MGRASLGRARRAQYSEGREGRAGQGRAEQGHGSHRGQLRTCHGNAGLVRAWPRGESSILILPDEVKPTVSPSVQVSDL